MDFSIRPATAKDFDGIFPLLCQLWPDKALHRDRLLEVFSGNAGSGNHVYLCAELNNRIVGFCSLMIKSSLWQEGLVGYINELVVDESVRGRGIGTSLMKKVIDIAGEKGCRRIELDSAFHRKEAHSFYQRMGFEKRAYLFSRDL